jgi:hypothetical protein
MNDTFLILVHNPQTTCILNMRNTIRIRNGGMGSEPASFDDSDTGKHSGISLLSSESLLHWMKRSVGTASASHPFCLAQILACEYGYPSQSAK